MLTSLLVLASSVVIRFPGGPRAVAAAGDLDHDGRADVLIGASFEDADAATRGLARVHSGADGHVLLEVRANFLSQAFGRSVAGRLDLDRDGTSDVAVGAPGHAYRNSSDRALEPLTFAGAVFVYSGKSGERLLTLRAGVVADEFGFELCSDGDLDGDGQKDLVVGAPGSRSVFAYSGKDGHELLHVTGDETAKRFGTSVGAVSDVDGDHCDDVLVGAPDDKRGLVVLVSGKDGHELRRWQSVEQRSRFGISVAGVGDVNGDGTSDVLVGADEEAGLAGEAHIFSGKTGIALAHMNGTMTMFSRFGSSVSALPDVDGDGVADLLVSDPDDDIDEEMALGQAPGSVLVFSGKTRKLLDQVRGEAHLDRLGYSIASVGDCDGDGVGDFAAEAHTLFGTNPWFRVYSGKTCKVLHTFKVSSLQEKK